MLLLSLHCITTKQVSAENVHTGHARRHRAAGDGHRASGAWGLLQTLAVDLNQRGNVRADTENYQTSRPHMFSPGDMRRGHSLVVWAIREGRQAARAVDAYLMGGSDLPR